MRPPKLTFYDRVGIPAIRNYFAIGLASLLLYYLVMSDGSSVSGLIACVFGLLGLCFNWPGYAFIFLMLDMWTTFIPDFGLFSNLTAPKGRRDFDRSSVVDLENLLHHASVLAYLISSFRLQSLADRGLPGESATAVGRLRDRETRIGDGDNPSMKAVFLSPRRPIWLVSDLELPVVLMTGIGAMVGGALVFLGLNALTKRIDFAGNFDMPIGGARLMTFVWTSFFAAMVVIAFFRIFSRREMTAKIARIVLLDLFYSENRREVERQRNWRKG